MNLRDSTVGKDKNVISNLITLNIWTPRAYRVQI